MTMSELFVPVLPRMYVPRTTPGGGPLNRLVVLSSPRQGRSTNPLIHPTSALTAKRIVHSLGRIGNLLMADIRVSQPGCLPPHQTARGSDQEHQQRRGRLRNNR